MIWWFTFITNLLLQDLTLTIVEQLEVIKKKIKKRKGINWSINKKKIRNSKLFSTNLFLKKLRKREKENFLCLIRSKFYFFHLKYIVNIFFKKEILLKTLRNSVFDLIFFSFIFIFINLFFFWNKFLFSCK
jgi:hypothetical protein